MLAHAAHLLLQLKVHTDHQIKACNSINYSFIIVRNVG